MIYYLIEIIFKNVSFEMIEPLLHYLTLNGKSVSNYHLTHKDIKIKWNKKNAINKIFASNKDFGLFINLKELKKYNVCLPNCGIAIYRFETSINLELNFELSDLKNYKIEHLAENLMELAKSIAAQYHIKEYLCGIEPAHDITTRLFTNETLGPFFFSAD